MEIHGDVVRWKMQGGLQMIEMAVLRKPASHSEFKWNEPCTFMTRKQKDVCSSGSRHLWIPTVKKKSVNWRLRTFSKNPEMPWSDHKISLLVIMQKDTNPEKHFIPLWSSYDTLTSMPFLFFHLWLVLVFPGVQISHDVYLNQPLTHCVLLWKNRPFSLKDWMSNKILEGTQLCMFFFLK